jgi:hypothetical protein
MQYVGKMNERSVVRVVGALIGVSGMWIAVSPLVLHYPQGSTAIINDLTVGVVVAIIAWQRSMAHTLDAMLAWFNVVLGSWLMASPWIIGYAHEPAPLRNNLIFGGLIAVIGAWSALASSGHQRRPAH